MDFLKETRFIERVQFFNGQRLFAADLQGVDAFNREMRWLHNKSLHQPGIGNGFAVTGKKGDREVTIGPGYAIDAEGREIVLTQSRVEPVPPVASEAGGLPALYDLTVSYPDDADLEEAETREGLCDTRGVIRLKEEPIFCWVRLNADGQPQDPKLKQDILTGQKLVLAQAEVLNCQLNKDLSIAQRLSARPSKQPYVCCGMAESAWQPMFVAPLDPQKVVSSKEGQEFLKIFGTAIRFFPFLFPVGLQMRVDTSECSFITTPCYSARIAGPRVKKITDATIKQLKDEAGGDGSEDGSGNATGRKFQFNFIVDGLVQIVEPKPTEFTATVLLMGQLLLPTEFNESDGKTFAGTLGRSATAGDSGQVNLPDNVDALIKKIIALFFSDWQLEWMGVEG